ncbi:ankyrin repeat-containing domain protein [Xylaria flabelliformis]|nr:ankyrin repeat-containing domain protein [Xylaria flabelliformis]
MSSSTGQLTAHVSNDESEVSCEEHNSMTAQEPANLGNAPAEIIINILDYLEAKKDWLCIARSCRRLSNFIVPELDKYTVGNGGYYAVWYACVANKPAILLRHIALDATVVNRYFTKDFCCHGMSRINGESSKGKVPLAVAIIAGSEAIVQLLLVNGADPNRPDLTTLTPFSLDWDLELDRNPTPWRPIQWAVMSRHESSVAIIKMLGAHSVNTNQAPGGCMADRADSHAPIFILLRLQKPKCGWSRDKQQTSCEEFNDDLRRLRDLRLRQLEALLQHGADPNIRYGSGPLTPIFFFLDSLAFYRPSFYFDNALALSQEKDAQADIVNEIATSVLDMLLNFGANIYELGVSTFMRLRLFRETPIHLACRMKDQNKPIIDWFLRNGVSIDSLDEAQGTPLMAYCSSAFKDLDLFRKFLSNGPLINHSDIKGRTALHYLCANQDLTPQVMEKAVKIMLDRGADPTFVSNEGRVPAQELDPVGSKGSSRSASSGRHRDVLLMLKRATETWNKRARKQEETKSKDSKNNKRLVLTHSEAQVDRPDNQPSDRERRASHEKDGRQNRKNGHENKKPGQGTASPVGGRSHNHATPKGSIRGNRREKQRDQGGNRGESHQNGGTQHINCDNDNGKGKETKDKRHNSDNNKEGTTPQGNDQSTPPPPPPPQDTFQEKVRGGKYCGAANQENHESSRREQHREINPEVTDKSTKPEEEPAKQSPSIASQSWFRRRYRDEAESPITNCELP